MCDDKILRLKRAIEEKKLSNLEYSKSKTTETFPPVKMSQAYAFMAAEDDSILQMISILERNG